jgi:hypothetical protein
MQSAEYEVPGFGSHQRHFHCGAITHFTNQDHLGRLPQSRSQPVRIIVEIVAELTLVEGGLLFRMNELDRILEGDDVNGLSRINFVQ